MDVQPAIVALLDHRRARRRSPSTIRQYTYQLQELWLAWRRRETLSDALESITAEEFTRYFQYLELEHVNGRTGAIGLAPETRAMAWRVLRGLWNFAARRKWLLESQHDFFRDDELIARPAVDERMRPVLADDILQALLDACLQFGDPEEHARNRALLLVLAESGMRVSELVGMIDERLRLPERGAKIIGKGNREEWVFWHNRASRALKAYLNVRSGKPGGMLWRRIGDGSEGMTADDVRRLVKLLAELAGVEVPRGAPVHSFRHRFAHKGIDSGLDVTQVGQLMRHRNAQTTFRYLRENAERLRRIRDKMGEDE